LPTKFADDTTVVGLINNNNETADREEVTVLAKVTDDLKYSLHTDSSASSSSGG
jgi:cysteine sulfinate desulfinase/cysteine desulfurase-like protein